MWRVHSGLCDESFVVEARVLSIERVERVVSVCIAKIRSHSELYLATVWSHS